MADSCQKTQEMTLCIAEADAIDALENLKEHENQVFKKFKQNLKNVFIKSYFNYIHLNLSTFKDAPSTLSKLGLATGKSLTKRSNSLAQFHPFSFLFKPK